jgi:hypothetical protein
MLPFLRNRDDGVGVGTVETKERKPDDGDSYDMLDAIAEDLLLAVEKKNKAMIKAALESFMDHIQAVDVEMDKEMME